MRFVCNYPTKGSRPERSGRPFPRSAMLNARPRSRGISPLPSVSLRELRVRAVLAARPNKCSAAAFSAASGAELTTRRRVVIPTEVAAPSSSRSLGRVVTQRRDPSSSVSAAFPLFPSPIPNRTPKAVFRSAGHQPRRVCRDHRETSSFSSRYFFVFATEMARANSEVMNLSKFSSAAGSLYFPFRPFVESESRKYAESYSRSRTSFVRSIS